eukprot:gene6329-12807_t
MEIPIPVLRKLKSLVTGGYGLEANILDERLRRLFARLPEKFGLEALTEFERVLRTSREKIMNPSGYLTGVVRRLSDHQESHVHRVSMMDAIGDQMTFRVHQKLNSMIEDGVCTAEEIDGRCRDMLKQLSEREVLAALEEVQKADRSKIMNISGYLMGILRRFRSRKEMHLHPHNVRDSVPPVDLIPAIPPELLDAMGFLPAPSTIPMELLYGHGDQEYVPEMSRPLDGFNLTPLLQDQLELLLDKKMCTTSALAVLREFQFCELSSVRNVAAYIIGISRRLGFKGDDRSAGGGAGQGQSQSQGQIISGSGSHFMGGGGGGGGARFYPGMNDDMATAGIGGGGGGGGIGGVFNPVNNRSTKKMSRDPRADFMAGGPGRGPGPGLKRPRPNPSEQFGDSPYGMGPGLGPGPGIGPGPSYGDNMYNNPSQKFKQHGQGQGGHHGHYPNRGGGGGGGMGMGMGGMGVGIDPYEYMSDEAIGRQRVDMEITKHVRAGLIEDSDIEDNIREFLAAQPPRIALKSIVDFCAKDMNRLNNKGAYLKGIIRKVVEKEGNLMGGGGGGGGNDGRSSGGGGGGGYGRDKSGGY